MSWKDMSTQERISEIDRLQLLGLKQYECAIVFGCAINTIQKFSHKHKIYWTQGARNGNKNALIHGQGRNTIMRLCQRVVKEDGRPLNICERCGLENQLINLPIHHKDRDRSNNIASNLEVLCHKCHNKEHESKRYRKDDGTYV